MSPVVFTLVVFSQIYVHVSRAHMEASSVRQLEQIRISRSKRNIQSCGIDFVFGKFGSSNGINKTQLSRLMKELSIGNDTSTGLSNCVKVSLLI